MRARRLCDVEAFQGVGSNACVLGEHDPAALPDGSKPLDVARVRIEFVVVYDDPMAGLPDRRRGRWLLRGTDRQKR